MLAQFGPNGRFDDLTRKQDQSKGEAASAARAGDFDMMANTDLRFVLK